MEVRIKLGSKYLVQSRHGLEFQNDFLVNYHVQAVDSNIPAFVVYLDLLLPFKEDTLKFKLHR